MKRSFLTLALIGALVPFMMGATCGGDKKNDDTALLLLTVALFPRFTGSCNVAASNYCTNFYGTTGSCASSISATKCVATNAYGACRTGNTEQVWYTGYANCTSASTCATVCASVGGTFNASYNGT